MIGRVKGTNETAKLINESLPQMLMTDTQIGLVAKAYYNDDNFVLPENQSAISIWNVYNLLTGANKSSYIDNFLDRSLNATQLADGLNKALYGTNEYGWVYPVTSYN